MAASNKSHPAPRKSGGRVIQSRDLMQEYLEKDLSRRRLLQGALAAAAVATGCGAAGSNPSPPPGPDAGTPTDRPTPTDNPAPQDNPPARMTHLIGMGQHDDHVMAAEAALAETTGFDFIQRGQRVYLKVNTNSGDPYPYSTSPDLIRWVVGKIRERGGEPFIGDRSFFGDRNTLGNFALNGIAGIAEELEVPLQVFGDPSLDGASRSVDWMDLPGEVEGLDARSAFWTGTMRIPVPVATADHIVALPVVKTHFIASFTMAMKGMIGIINPVDRSRSNNLGQHTTTNDKLHKQVAFMNKAMPAVSLVVLDGWNALIGGGPTPRDAPAATRTAEPHVVIVSRDRVAADLTGVALLKTLSATTEAVQRTTAWRNRQIVTAVANGIGLTDRAMYDLSGPTVENVDRIRELVMA